MSVLFRRALTTAVAVTLVFAAFTAQAPVANADEVCAEVSYTVLGTLSDDLGDCVSTGFDTFLTVDITRGDPSLVEVSLYVNIVLP